MADSIATITIQARDQASAVMASVASSTRGARIEVEELGDASGKLGGDAAKLAGALSLVSPEAATGAMAIADLMDVVEVASGAMKALGLTLGSTLAILGPVAVAVGILAVAWHGYSQELEQAEAKQKAASEAAKAATAVYKDLQSAVAALDEQYEVSVGLKSEAAAQAEAASAKVSEQYAPAIALQQAVIDGINKEIETRQKHYAALVNEEGGREAVAQKTNELRAALEGEQREMEAILARRNEQLDKADAIVASVVRERQEREGATAAAKAQSAAESEARAVAAAAAAELAGQADFEARLSAARAARLAEESAAFEEMYGPAVDEAAAFLAEFNAELEGLVPASAEGDLERLTRLQDELTLAFSRGTIDVERYRQEMERLAAVQSDMDTSAAVGGAADAAGMAAGGPDAVMGAVASSGPWGALIAAIVDLVANFADVGDMFNNFTISFNESIAAFPQTLSENLSKWLETGTNSAIEMLPNFIAGLADALPGLISDFLAWIPQMAGLFVEAMIIDLPKAGIALVLSLMDPNTWIDVVQSFVKALVDAWNSLWGKVDEEVGAKQNEMGAGKTREKSNWFDDTWANLTSGDDYVGSNAVGSSYVHKTGMSLVHEGEVIDQGRSRGGGASAGGRSSAVTVIVNGFAVGSVEDLARSLNRTLGDSGRQLTLAAA